MTKHTIDIHSSEFSWLLDYLHKVSKAFELSDYPDRPFDHESELLYLHIRVPPSVPMFLRSRNANDAYKVFKSFPSIEIIEIHAQFQRLGLFSALVQFLLDTSDVEAICVSNVSNIGFREYLINSYRWITLESLLPSFMQEQFGSRSFYTTNEIFNKRF